MAGTYDVRVAKTTAEYTGCATSGKTYSSGMDFITLDKAGTFYFIYAYPLHCDQGMKMEVVVGSISASITNGTSNRPATPPPIAAPPPPPTTPLFGPPPAASPLAAPPPPILPPRAASPFAAPPPSLNSPQLPAPTTPLPGLSLTVPPPRYPPGSLPPMSSTNLSCPSSNMSCNMKKVSKSSIVLPVVIVAIVVSSAAVAIVTCILVVQRRRSYENVALTQAQTTGGSKLKNIVVDLYPRTCTYKELSKATKSFSVKELLGRGV